MQQDTPSEGEVLQRATLSAPGEENTELRQLPTPDLQLHSAHGNPLPSYLPSPLRQREGPGGELGLGRK